MRIPCRLFTIPALRVAMILWVLPLLLMSGCGVSGPDDPATIQSLKDLGVLVVPNTEGQVNGLNALPLDPDKLTQAINLSPKLKILKTITAMEGVPLTNEHLATIGGNGNLVELTIDGAPITDDGVAKLSGCSKLESLSLVNTAVTEASLPMLGKLPKLNMLNLNDTKVDGGFEHLKSCKNMQWILIGGLNISDEQATAISKIPGIQHVTLSDTTKISEGAVKTLKSAPDCTVDVVANPSSETVAPAE